MKEGRRQITNLITQLMMVLFACLIMNGISSCNNKSVKKTTDVEEASFMLGAGGGVSGRYEQYKVYESGQVVWYDFKTKSYGPYTTLSKSMNATLWNEIRALELKSLELDDPGNYTYYIELNDQQGSHKIKWSDESNQAPKEVKRFFSLAENALKNTK